MIEVLGKGEPRGIWKESCGGLWGRGGRLWRRGVGVGRWAGKHAHLVGGVVSKHKLLVGGWRALREEFLASESRKKRKTASVLCDTIEAGAQVWPSSLCIPDSMPLLQIP